MNKSFSPTEAIGFGWNKFKENKKFWIVTSILVFMLSGAGNYNFDDSSSQKENKNSMIYEQNVETNTSNELNFYNNTPAEIESEELPFIPKQVDDVLGISDQRDRGNTGMFIALFVIAALLFFLPLIIASILVSGAVQMGVTKFFLTAARGADAKYETILSEIKLNKSYRFLAVSFLYCLLVIVGLVFFIIPGIYFGLKYMFVTYAVVDRDAKIGEAFSMSGTWTRGNKWKLMGLGILVILVNLLGLVALFYGLLVSVPVTMIASAYAYDRLSKSS